MSLNSSNWAESFAEVGSELLNLDSYESILTKEKYQTYHKMSVWSIFGVFKCKKCSNKWNSTKCTVDVLYRYNASAKCGEVKIEQEFKQGCKKCEQYAAPFFDQEATDKAMSKVVERIKKVFYNVCAPGNEESDPHSRASARKNPHDSARCEACKLGICNFSKDDSFVPQFRTNKSYAPLYRGERSRIGWSLTVEGKIVKVLTCAQSKQSSFAFVIQHKPSTVPINNPWTRESVSNEVTRILSTVNEKTRPTVTRSQTSVSSSARVATATPSNSSSSVPGEKFRRPEVTRMSSMNETSNYPSYLYSGSSSYATRRDYTVPRSATYSNERTYSNTSSTPIDPSGCNIL